MTCISTNPRKRAAPPKAYDNLHFEGANLILSPAVAGHSRPTPKPLVESTADPNLPRSPAETLYGLEAITGGLREAANHADNRYAHMYRLQVRYYVDRVGERIAVVDAAHISYDNHTNDAIVRVGRLGFGADGQPEIIHPPPQDPNRPEVGPARLHRIPVQEDRK